jgi:hypothetical protein
LLARTPLDTPFPDDEELELPELEELLELDPPELDDELEEPEEEDDPLDDELEEAELDEDELDDELDEEGPEEDEALPLPAPELDELLVGAVGEVPQAAARLAAARTVPCDRRSRNARRS